METIVNANSVVIIPLVITLTGIIKNQELFNKKRMPLVALGLGLLVTLLATYAFGTDQNILMVIFSGFVNGSSAVGLYEAGKNTGVNEKITDTIDKLH